MVELTGYKFRALQIRWLLEHGYKFEVPASGWPIVLKLHVENRLGGFGSKIKKIEEPDFSNNVIFG